MASLRRSKVLSPDGQTAKFLYTIIKQLDLKAVDWNEVASGLDITNGHAARMRYSRFKAQIEGLPTQSSKPRAPRPKKNNSTMSKGKEKNKPGYEPGKVDDWKAEDDDDGDVKMEQESGIVVKKEGLVRVKQEEATVDIRTDTTIENFQIKPEPGLVSENNMLSEIVAKVKQEPTAESMNLNLSPTSGIASININSFSIPPTPTVSTLGFSPGPTTPKMILSQKQAPPMMPPRATVSLADLQLPPIPRPTSQMQMPEFSYPLTPMDFDFDFNAPIPQSQLQPLWQPQFDMFCPVTVKQEMMYQ